MLHLLLLSLSFLLGIAWAHRAARRRMARSRRAGRRGERRAWRVLRRRGFRILATEVEAVVRVRVDGRAREFTVRADAVVRRRFRRYVVEVKTGVGATVAHRATRRQLLEYAHAFSCRAVLLVDAERGIVRRVEFGR